MKNVKHTPGPWKLAPASIEGITGKTICSFEVGEFSTAQVFADAKLIVVAPDMLKALENLVVRFAIEGYGQNGVCKCLQFEDNEDCRHLRAIEVLAKATGAE